jgi:hypothetical protein
MNGSQLVEAAMVNREADDIYSSENGRSRRTARMENSLNYYGGRM